MININKYESGVIYKITNTVNNEVYVGSTTTDLELRMVKHKCDAKKRPELSKFYTFMNEHGVEHFEIEIVEEFPCERKTELERREGEIIKAIGTLNQRIAGRTKEEYMKEFEEYFKKYKKEYKKKWQINNREHYLQKEREYKKTYREKYHDQIREKARAKVECECGGTYTLSHKAEHMNSKKHLTYLGTYNEEEYKKSKRYTQIKHIYAKQKDKLDEEKTKEYKKQWYEEHKEETSQKAKEKNTCECGDVVCRGAYTRHLKSQKHQAYLQQNNNNLINNIDNVSSSQEECKEEQGESISSIFANQI